MSELSKVNTPKVTLMIHGKEREIKYNFSAWAILEEEMGGLENLPKLEENIEKRPFNTIPHLLYVGLVDKEGVTEENILSEYGLGDIKMIAEKFSQALYGSLPEDDSSKKVELEAKK